MKATRTSYIIFVRPPGSQMWTQHMKDTGIPWTTYDMDKADDEADNVTLNGKYCTRVVAIKHPREIDEYLYAQHGDGDTRFIASTDGLLF